MTETDRQAGRQKDRQTQTHRETQDREIFGVFLVSNCTCISGFFRKDRAIRDLESEPNVTYIKATL